MTDVQKIYPDGRVILREVGLRDGLQLVKTFPSTQAKQRWVRDEYAAGVRHASRSVRSCRQRPFRNSSMCAMSSRPWPSLPGAHGIALALNERGANEALASGVAEIASVVSATEEHSQANANRSRESGDRQCQADVRSARRERAQADRPCRDLDGARAARSRVRSIRTRWSGWSEKCFEAGVDAVGIADTVGYAGPKAVGDLTRAAVKIAGKKPICVHLHDTRGMGIANAAAALDEGARILDGSLGGLGGCPFAPGATGNVVFEDLVFLCESKGFATGIDIDRLVAVRAILREAMPNEALYGGLARAGLPSRERRRRRPRVSAGRPQPQRVADHADRRQRHRGGRDDRRQQDAEGGIEDARRDRDAGRVVDEGEEQVLADVAHGRLRQRSRADDAGEIAFQQRDAGAFHRDIGAGAHGDADFGGRERRRIVDAVAGHRDDAACLLQLARPRRSSDPAAPPLRPRQCRAFARRRSPSSGCRRSA